MDHIVKNRPGYKLDGLVRVWPNASGLEVSRCVGIIWPTFWQDATGQLPVSHFQTRFRSSTDVLDNQYQLAGTDLVLADFLRFGPNGSVLLSRSGPDANRIRHVYWVRTSLTPYR